MKPDPEFLRRHYASLSDGELLSLDRADLVEVARRIFDEEVNRRRQNAPQRPTRPAYQPEEDGELDQLSAEDDASDWLEDAAEAYSRYVVAGATPAPEAVAARDALDADGIPCHLELYEEPQEEGEQRYRWRVLVPGKFVHRATSVLDRDIFNAEFESGWRAHLEILSDEDLRVMEPQYAFCGLYDRIERINRAYDEEIERRRLKR